MSMEQREPPTVLDLRALKGQKQLTMLRCLSLDEAAAAEAAGIDSSLQFQQIFCFIRDTVKLRQVFFLWRGKRILNVEHLTNTLNGVTLL